MPFRALVELVAVIALRLRLTARCWPIWRRITGCSAHVAETGAGRGGANRRSNLIGSALIFPRGRKQKVEGGYRLTGRWPFFERGRRRLWNLVGVRIAHDEDSGGTSPRIFLLPASDYTVIDTWHVIGLSGTGSNDVSVEDVFVPDYRTLAVDQIAGGPNPGSTVNPSVLYQLPAISLFAF